MKVKKYLVKIIEYLEDYRASFWQIAAALVGTIFLRLAIEYWLSGKFYFKDLPSFFYGFSHNFLFFLLTYFIFLFFLNFYLKTGLQKTANFLIWGFLVILTPPLIDWTVSGGKGFFMFYTFDSLAGLFKRFFLFFGDSPHIGVTYGVRFEIALVVIFSAIYAFLKTSSYAKTLLTGIFSYTILFILGTFPSWLAFFVILPQKSPFKVNDVDIAVLFIPPGSNSIAAATNFISVFSYRMSLVYGILLPILVLLFLFLKFKEKFWEVVKNIRFLRIFYHWGLLMIGIGLAIYYFEYPSVDFFFILALLNLLLAICFSWIGSVFINDYCDKTADKITNQERFSVKNIFSGYEYVTIGTLFFISSLFLAAVVDPKIAYLMILYQVLSWIYSAYPLRLKRFPFLASFISALASLLVLLVGFIFIAPSGGIEKIPAAILWLLVIGYTLSVPVKDLKDINGDRADGVWTLPVLLGEERGRLVIGIGIFIAHLSSVIFINEPRLFWFALIFGSFSFWLINWKKIKPAQLPLWIFLEAFLFGMVLVKVIFF